MWKRIVHEVIKTYIIMFYHEIYYIINHQIMSNQIMSNQDFSSLQQIFGFSKCSNFFEEKKMQNAKSPYLAGAGLSFARSRAPKKKKL